MRRETSTHRAAFETFYANGRLFGETGKSLDVSDQTVRNWAEWFGWHERADHRDREAAKKAERDAIARRARVLTEQRQAGELLRRRGTQYYTTKEVMDGREAIAAIKEGVALERSAENLPSFIFDLMGLTDAELEAERLRLLRQLPPGAAPAHPGAADEDEGEAEDSGDEAEGLESE